MGKIITICLRKGGVGKTSTAVNLASALAKHGKRVLLVDLDSQGNAGQAVGVVDNQNNIATVLSGQSQLQNAIRIVGDICLLPSGSMLTQIENALTAKAEVFAIKAYLDTVKDLFDYIVIDTPPNDGIITRNALTASDMVLLPCQAHTFALSGLQQAIELINTVKQYYNPSLKLIGILPTMLQQNTNMGALIIEQLKNDYGNLVLPYAIPVTIKVTESQLAGKPLVDYEPHSQASEAFKGLADYVIQQSNLDGGNN